MNFKYYFNLVEVKNIFIHRWGFPLHFRFFADFKDFNHPTLWEGAIVQGLLYGVNCIADQALRFCQKIVGIGHELIELCCDFISCSVKVTKNNAISLISPQPGSDCKTDSTIRFSASKRCIYALERSSDSRWRSLTIIPPLKVRPFKFFC